MRSILSMWVGAALSLINAAPCIADGTSETVIPALLEYTDDASRALRIDILRKEKLPEGTQEIRLWTGFGVSPPFRMVSLRVAPSGIATGRVFLWYPRLDYLSANVRREFRDELNADWGCTRPVHHGRVEACRSALEPKVNWKQLLRSLDALGLRTLPDQSELPKPEFVVSDGVAIVVEILDGPVYRAYGYSNPWAYAAPEFEAAEAIMSTLAEAISPDP